VPRPKAPDVGLVGGRLRAFGLGCNFRLFEPLARAAVVRAGRAPRASPRVVVVVIAVLEV